MDAPTDSGDRRALVLLVAPIVVLIAAGTVANAITPYLLKEHPLLLVALEARNRNLLAAASRVDAVPFVVFATLRRIASDPLFFLLGKRYGDRGLAWVKARIGGGDVLVRLTEGGFRRAAPAMVLCFPGALVCVLAGVTGMRTRTFLVLNLAGTIAAVVVLRAFAGVLEGPIEAVLRFNDRYVWWLTGASVLLVALYVVLQRGDRDLSEVDELLDDGSEAPPDDA